MTNVMPLPAEVQYTSINTDPVTDRICAAVEMIFVIVLAISFMIYMHTDANPKLHEKARSRSITAIIICIGGILGCFSVDGSLERGLEQAFTHPSINDSQIEQYYGISDFQKTRYSVFGQPKTNTSDIQTDKNETYQVTFVDNKGVTHHGAFSVNDGKGTLSVQDNGLAKPYNVKK